MLETKEKKQCLIRCLEYLQSIEHLSGLIYSLMSSLCFPLAGKWANTNSADIYKEKWFHGKISREEVQEALLMQRY
jgi:hypothetical protein